MTGAYNGLVQAKVLLYSVWDGMGMGRWACNQAYNSGDTGIPPKVFFLPFTTHLDTITLVQHFYHYAHDCQLVQLSVLHTNMQAGSIGDASLVRTSFSCNEATAPYHLRLDQCNANAVYSYTRDQDGYLAMIDITILDGMTALAVGLGTWSNDMVCMKEIAVSTVTRMKDAMTWGPCKITFHIGQQEWINW